MLDISSDLLNATIAKVTTSHGAYGDYEEGSTGTSYPCRFREISQFADQQNQEIKTSDAMAWTDSEAAIGEQDIVSITHDSTERFRVLRVTRARGASSTVSFLKLELERYHG